MLTDLEHLCRIYSNPTHDKRQWLLLQFIVLLMMDAKVVQCTIPWPIGHGIVQCTTDLEYLHRIYSIPTHDKHQWLLLQFIVLLMMDTKVVQCTIPWQIGHGLVGATTLDGFWPTLRFCFTTFYLYTSLSLSSFSLSSSLDPLLLGQAISVLVFLLVFMNMVPIQ